MECIYENSGRQMLQVSLQSHARKSRRCFTKMMQKMYIKVKFVIRLHVTSLSAAVSPPRDTKLQHYKLYDETEAAETLAELREASRSDVSPATQYFTHFSLVSPLLHTQQPPH